MYILFFVNILFPHNELRNEIAAACEPLKQMRLGDWTGLNSGHGLCTTFYCKLD